MQTDNIKITMYSASGCGGCFATERRFKQLGLEYTVLKIPPNVLPAHLAHYKQLPIVEVKDTDKDTVWHWSGFVPTNIDQIAPEVVYA